MEKKEVNLAEDGDPKGNINKIWESADGYLASFIPEESGSFVFNIEDSEEENMSIDENENELFNQLKVNFNGDDTNMKDSQGFTRSQPVPIECHRYEPRKVASKIIFGRKKSKHLARKRK